MIFAAGLGTRLAPLTLTRPKALIEVGGKPMLQRAIEGAAQAGATRIVVNVHHHSAMIREWIDHRYHPASVLVSDETEHLLDTGAGVAHAAPLLDPGEPVMLLNADICTDLDLAEMVAAYSAAPCSALLLAQNRESSRRLLWAPAGGRMMGWKRTDTGQVRSPWPPELLVECEAKAFGGIHIISPGTLVDIVRYWHNCRNGEPFSITDYYIDRCRDIDIYSYTPAAPYRWVDIGRPETLEKARGLFYSPHQYDNQAQRL